MAGLLERLQEIPFADRDAWVDRVLGFKEPPGDVALPRGAVPYLPCGVAEILAAMRELPIRPDDAFVDLGSGLGRVAILVHLLTGARTHGIELQPHLVAAARERAAALGLSAVTFEQADASQCDLRGSVFFLYAPFNGELLARVLKRLERAPRPLSVCCVDLELRGVPWLVPQPATNPALSIFRAVR